MSRENCFFVGARIAPTGHPTAAVRAAHSLNVTVAAGICLHEWARQNRPRPRPGP